MCQQHYVKCKNRSCQGVAEYLHIIPCDKKPNCETTRVRIPGKRGPLAQCCPECAKLTKQERTSQVKHEYYRALREKQAAEQGLPPPRPMRRARIGESQAESSAAGANARADPSDDEIHPSGSQSGTNPQIGSPQLASSDAPAPGSDNNLLPPQDEIDETLYTSGTPEPESPSSHAAAPGFMPGSGSENLLSNQAGNEALSSQPAPGFQHGTDPQFQAPPVPQQETQFANVPELPIDPTQFGNVPKLPIDPIVPFQDILRANGINLDDRQVAEQLLRDLGLWPAISSQISSSQTPVSSTPYFLEEGEANLADFFPPPHTLVRPAALPLPTGPENQTMPSLDTSSPPRDHSTEEQQDAQELLEMADWADGALGDLDHLE
ncbi:hypothetical protein MMC07_005614 [Pseudocyphellaria aurata]|nr:hypothetical protein [Pseudocyphellaria aurata]